MRLPTGWREDPREAAAGSGRRRFLFGAAAAGGAQLRARVAGAVGQALQGQKQV